MPRLTRDCLRQQQCSRLTLEGEKSSAKTKALYKLKNYRYTLPCNQGSYNPAFAIHRAFLKSNYVYTCERLGEHLEPDIHSRGALKTLSQGVTAQ
jgi:hypothetical protein